MTSEPNTERKTKAQHQKLADLLGKGVPVTKAMVQAGWSEAQAAKGYAKVPEAVLKLMPKRARTLIALGKTTEPDDMRALVHGRLIENVTKGTDKAAQSAKILGSSRELNMWQPDTQSGVIVLTVPQSVLDRKAELLKDEPEEL
jgi:hypothetical protein